MPTWAWVLLVAAASLAGLTILLLALWRVRLIASGRLEWTGDFDMPREGFLHVSAGFPGFRRTWEWTRGNAAADATDVVPEPPPPAPPSPPAATAATARDARPAGNATAPPPPGGPHAASPSPSSSSSSSSSPSSSTASSDAPKASPDSDPDADALASSSSSSSRRRRKPRDPHRLRRALFRLSTDGPAWGHLVRYGLRVLRFARKLLHARVRIAAGHPDPVLLGRVAGYWHAASPVLPTGDTTLEFRFQDRHPTLRVHVEGGFSALSLAWFGLLSLGAFPAIRLGWRAWRGWKEHALTGWRDFAYRRIQKW